MPSYLTPKKNTEFIFYCSLVSQANGKIFQANPTLAAGDVKVSIDGAAEANITTLPAVTPAGSRRVKVTLSTSEMNGDNIQLTFHDAAGDEWNDLTINIPTTTRQIDDLAFPATSGRSMVVDASGLVDANTVKVGPTGSGTAQTARDLGNALPAAAPNANGGLPILSSSGTTLGYTITTLATYTGNTPQTGDSYARLGAPAGASVSADVAAAKVDTAAIKVKTDQFMFTVANQVDANALSGGSGGDATEAKQDVIIAALAVVDGNVDDIETAVAGLATAAELAKVPKSDGTVAWNSTAIASMTTAMEAAILNEGDATALLAAIAAKVEEFLVNEGDATATIAAISTAVWAAGTRTLTAGTNIQLPSNGLANVTTWTVDITGTISTVTNLTNLPAITSNWITAAGIATDAGTELATALLDLANGVETGVTVRQYMQRTGAVIAGKVSGAQSGTEVFVGLDGSTTRTTVTVTATGNRTAVVYA